MNSGDEKLRELFKNGPKSIGRSKPSRNQSYDDGGWDEDDMNVSGLNQWSTIDGKIFIPTTLTKKSLVPGFYEVRMNPSKGLYFQKIPTKGENLLRFPDSNVDKIIKEIESFWSREDLFKHYGLTYKRGIILWGVPGGGKSSCIHQISEDVINRNGVVIKFGVPEIFKEGIRSFREIQPETPCVVLMEDIDATLEMYNESEILNIIDGVDDCHKTIFLATTNYPENLGERIMNRPSRFDKRFEIGTPDKESRKLYFEYLLKNNEKSEIPDSVKDMKINIDKWVEDTDNYTIAHLKELFIAVVILGDSYDNAIETLTNMIDIGNDVKRESKSSMGFVNNSKKIW